MNESVINEYRNHPKIFGTAHHCLDLLKYIGVGWM